MSAVARPSRVVVLYGGQSAEHDISCVSARFVAVALGDAGFETIPVGITRQGQWVDTAVLVAGEGDADAFPSPDIADAVHLLGTPDLAALAGGDTVVFPVLHGPMGEDGTIQGHCEVLGLPYVGAGVLGSAVSMDKSVAKEVLRCHGLPQVRWQSAPPADVDDDYCDGLELNLGFPLFVKPANMGSSIGISKVKDRASLEKAVALAAAYDDRIVFEEAIMAREIEVAVLGNEAPEASVPGEIVLADEFYDDEGKYLTDSAELLVPAPLNVSETAVVRDLAVQAFRAVRAEGMARVDFFLDPERQFLVNEVNTIPGFTPISMYPRLWAETGVPPAELVTRLVDLALERQSRRRGHRRER